MIGVHELQPKLGGEGGVGKDGTVLRDEGEREVDGMDTKFPACGIASHDGGGGSGKDGVAEELVAKARAEDLDGWVGNVEVWGLALVVTWEGREGWLPLVKEVSEMIQRAGSYAEAADERVSYQNI